VSTELRELATWLVTEMHRNAQYTDSRQRNESMLFGALFGVSVVANDGQCPERCLGIVGHGGPHQTSDYVPRKVIEAAVIKPYQDVVAAARRWEAAEAALMRFPAVPDPFKAPMEHRMAAFQLKEAADLLRAALRAYDGAGDGGMADTFSHDEAPDA